MKPQALQIDLCLDADGVLTLDDLPFHKGDAVRIRIEPLSDSRTRQGRVLGLHEGAVWTSEDFDAPLPDSFWVGDDVE